MVSELASRVMIHRIIHVLVACEVHKPYDVTMIHSVIQTFMSGFTRGGALVGG